MAENSSKIKIFYAAETADNAPGMTDIERERENKLMRRSRILNRIGIDMIKIGMVMVKSI